MLQPVRLHPPLLHRVYLAVQVVVQIQDRVNIVHICQGDQRIGSFNTNGHCQNEPSMSYGTWTLQLYSKNNRYLGDHTSLTRTVFYCKIQCTWTAVLMTVVYNMYCAILRIF